MRLVIILFFSLAVSTGYSQYTVTKVMGDVKKKTGEKVTVGSKLKESDVLVFSTPEDKVRVIVTGKGTYVLTPSPTAAVEKKKLIEMLKSTLQIKSKEGYLSSRAQTIETVPEVFETIDSINSKNLIAKENYYLYDPRTYNIASGGKFFLQIEQEGQKPTIKPLKTRGDTLFINKADFDIGGNATATYKLGYFDKEENKSKAIVDIDPYFDQAGEMEKIIRVVASNSSIKDDKTLVQKECYEEVYEALGKPSDLLFENAFKKVINGLKK